jgi:hypothetical protein
MTLVEIGSYVELNKAITALKIKKQLAPWLFSNTVIPTFNIGSSALYERIEKVYHATTGGTFQPKYAEFWTSLIITNKDTDKDFQLTNDNDVVETITVFGGESFSLNNVRIKKIVIPSSTNAIRVIGGY